MTSVSPQATTPRKGAKEESNDDGDEAGPSTQATNQVCAQPQLFGYVQHCPLQSLPKREVAKAGGKKAKAASASDPVGALRPLTYFRGC